MPPSALAISPDLRSGLAGLAGEMSIEGDTVHIHSQAVAADLHVVTGWAVGRGLELPDLAVTRPTLEDVYLELMAGSSQ